MSQDILDGQTGNGENPMMQRALLTGLLVAGAAYYVIRHRNREDSDMVSAPAAVEGTGNELVQRGQHLLESTLDHLSEQAMSEVKVIVKNGLHRLEQIIDDL